MSLPTALSLIGWALYGVGIGIWIRDPDAPRGFFPTGRGGVFAISGNIVWLVQDVITHDRFSLIWGTVWTILAIWWWRRNGGGKGLKKAAKELGEKSRAKVQELVDNLTPSPIPSPVGA